MATYNVDTGEDLARLLVEAQPGDQLLIGPHRLGRPYGGNFTVRAHGLPSAPILIRALDGAAFSGCWSFDSSFVTYEDLQWENFGSGPHVGRESSAQLPIRGLTFRGCRWSHGTSAMRAWYVEDLLYENCHWTDVRSREPGLDSCMWVLKRYGKRITFRDCTAQDFGSDWIQVMPNTPICGPAEDILIENCAAWINRPYGCVSWHDYSSNCGENAIDVKGYYTRRVVIRGGSYGAIRATVDGQDCSGDSAGPIVRVHYGAREVRLEQVRLFDAPVGVAVSLGSDASSNYVTGDVDILGCIFDRVLQPVSNPRNLTVNFDPGWTPEPPAPPPPDPEHLLSRARLLRDLVATAMHSVDTLIADLERM